MSERMPDKDLEYALRMAEQPNPERALVRIRQVATECLRARRSEEKQAELLRKKDEAIRVLADAMLWVHKRCILSRQAEAVVVDALKKTGHLP